MGELEFERQDVLPYQETGFDAKVRKVVERMLADPMSLPSEYKAWLKLHLEQVGLQIPISQINGNFLVEDTAAKLGGNIHGRNGMIRGGSSPYDFFQLSYDAVYEKWVSSFLLACAQTDVYTTNSTSATYFGHPYSTYLLVPYGAFVDAGMKPQVRMTAVLQSDNASGTATGSMEFATYNSGDTVSSGTAASWSIASTGTSYVAKDTGWQDIPSLTKKTLLLGLFTLKTNNASYGVGIQAAVCWLRWVSA